jgi:hypothetical protein
MRRRTARTSRISSGREDLVRRRYVARCQRTSAVVEQPLHPPPLHPFQPYEPALLLSREAVMQKTISALFIAIAMVGPSLMIWWLQ